MSQEQEELLRQVRDHYQVTIHGITRLPRGQGTRNWVLEGPSGRFFSSSMAQARTRAPLRSSAPAGSPPGKETWSCWQW